MTLRGWKDADWAAFEPIFREVVAGRPHLRHRPHDRRRGGPGVLVRRGPPGRRPRRRAPARRRQDGSQPARPGRSRRHRVVHGRVRGPGTRRRPCAGGVRRRVAPRARATARIQFNAVVATNTAAVGAVAVAGLRGRRHRPRRLPAPRRVVRRAARDAPRPHGRAAPHHQPADTAADADPARARAGASTSRPGCSPSGAGAGRRPPTSPPTRVSRCSSSAAPSGPRPTC